MEFNEELEELQEILNQVDNLGDYYCQGTSGEIAIPKITIKDFGICSLPFQSDHIKKLVSLSIRAPYGKGTKTITDINIRKVWQIDSNKIKVEGEKFNKWFGEMLMNVGRSLGLGDEKIGSNLYKMLIYDQGAFFLPHRDTEKENKMFATLVISLPSQHTGGDLIINHGKNQVTISLLNNSVSEFKYVAFYADCKHEVKPVESGHRVCLVYNLIRSGKRTISNDLTWISDHRAILDDVVQVLKVALGQSQVGGTIVYVLDHEYTLQGFSLNMLKGKDAGLAFVLMKACSKLQDITFGMGSLSIDQSSNSEDFDDYVKQQIDLENLISLPDGKSLNTIIVDQNQILPQDVLINYEPFNGKKEERTGNEGATFERSYRVTGLVIIWDGFEDDGQSGFPDEIENEDEEEIDQDDESDSSISEEEREAEKGQEEEEEEDDEDEDDDEPEIINVDSSSSSNS